MKCDYLGYCLDSLIATVFDAELSRPPIRLGRVAALHLKPERGLIVPVQALECVAGKGFIGDYSFGRRKRQALLISFIELDYCGYAAGQLRENVTVDFPGLQDLLVGTRLVIGTAELEIESDCPPCSAMARRIGEDPKEFISKTTRRRGMLAKVVRTGVLKVGDEVHHRSD